MPRVDFASILIESGTGVVGGGLQRMAWEASQMIGLMSTGGLLLGGIAIQAMVDQPMLQQVGKAAAISGATVAGWVGAEKFLISGTPRTPLAGAAQHRALQEAAARRALGGRDGVLAKNSFAVVDERERTIL